MGKKAKLRAKQAVEVPIECPILGEAAYYARKCGITVDEAAKIIREATARTSLGNPGACKQKPR
ncbi:MAG: hypothetical protein EOQ50_19430 [Mesorhizobium sp.]|nr:MAG: hypothetical protein EOQ50_19430 [Mesorhizobium sp.]